MSPHRRPRYQHRFVALLLGAATVLTAVTSCSDPELVSRLELLERGSLAGKNPVPHRGVRVVQMPIGGRIQAHREAIAVFSSVDIGAALTEVNGAAPTDVQKLLFVKNARNNFRYRDLSVDGVDRVLANYDVQLESGVDTVAGRPTFHFVARRKDESRASLEIWGDETTGVALRVVRKDHDGTVSYSMTYEHIEYGPLSRTVGDIPTLPAAPRAVQEGSAFQALDIAAELLGEGLDGFVRAHRQYSEITADGKSYQACVDRFTDGLQHLFVVQGNPEYDFWVVPPPSTPGKQLTIYSSNMASMNVVWARRDERSFAAYGPYPEKRLAEFIQGYLAAK